jgi:hypothetical protein
MVSLNDIAFAANPVPIVRGDSGHRVGKHRLAIDLDIDGDGDAAFFSGGFERRAQCPGNRGIKIFELQARFLKRDFFEILIYGHELSVQKREPAGG